MQAAATPGEVHERCVYEGTPNILRILRGSSFTPPGVAHREPQVPTSHAGGPATALAISVTYGRSADWYQRTTITPGLGGRLHVGELAELRHARDDAEARLEEWAPPRSPSP